MNHADLSADKYPSTFTLKSITVTTGDKDKVELYIFGPAEVQTLRSSGWGKDGQEFNKEMHDWAYKNQNAYFQTVNYNEGDKQPVGKALAKGEYWICICSHNSTFSATVNVEAEIGK